MRAGAVSAGEGDSEQEKVVVKAICQVLNGFHFNEVPDAV
jgi:hypothetical protein